jgi:hypothetical protein
MRFIVKIICLSIILIIADIACGADFNYARIDAEFPDKVNETDVILLSIGEPFNLK